MVNYIFDVDGTLTPSRGKMDPMFAEFFKGWVRNKNVYLLTGSDAEKTIEQVGRDIWSSLISYQCSGNVIYAYGKKVYELAWPDKFDEDWFRFQLEKKWRESPYPDKLGVDGNHIEVRKGLINFSTVGRNCTLEQRKHYHKWDQEHGERKKIVEWVETLQVGAEAAVGGEISVDIYPIHKNKGQVLEYLKGEGPIYFFGDQTQPGGNDHALASKLEFPNVAFPVSGPEDTIKVLKDLEYVG